MADLDLATLANIAEIMGLFTLMGGFVFAILQLRQAARRQREAAMIEMLRTYQSPLFLSGYTAVLALPDDLTPESAIKLPASTVESIFSVASVTETLGLLVHRRLVPLEIVDEFVGVNVIEFWRKVRPFAEYRRAATGEQGAYTWTQWLAERLEAHRAGRPKLAPHERYRDWKP